VVGSGHAPLDAQLPGGGWPCQALTELLIAHCGSCEWRLLWPALSRIQAQGDTVFLVGAPHTPHLRGLRLMGLSERQFVWVKADSPRERLWAAAQIIQSGQAGAVMAWLPQADARALRRLQASTSHCEAPVFVLRPASAANDTSPAPLRLSVGPGREPWLLNVNVVKRRGPMFESVIEVASLPGGMATAVAPRMAARMAAIKRGQALRDGVDEGRMRGAHALDLAAVAVPIQLPLFAASVAQQGLPLRGDPSDTTAQPLGPQQPTHAPLHLQPQPLPEAAAVPALPLPQPSLTIIDEQTHAALAGAAKSSAQALAL
jgi:protein ImuA